jgi:hypothetical protein
MFVPFSNETGGRAAAGAGVGLGAGVGAAIVVGAGVAEATRPDAAAVGVGLALPDSLGATTSCQASASAASTTTATMTIARIGRFFGGGGGACHCGRTHGTGGSRWGVGGDSPVGADSATVGVGSGGADSAIDGWARRKSGT